MLGGGCRVETMASRLGEPWSDLWYWLQGVDGIVRGTVLRLAVMAGNAWAGVTVRDVRER